MHIKTRYNFVTIRIATIKENPKANKARQKR
jgi:hypothetical protein